MVAAAAAAKLPQRVRAIVLEDPPWQTLGTRIHDTAFHSLFLGMQRVALRGGSIEEMARAMAQIEVGSPGSGSAVKLGEVRDAASLRFGAACLARVDPAVLEPIISGQWLTSYEQEAVLDAIRCPTLLLQADWSAGGMLADAEAARAQQLIANCTAVRLQGVGHLLHWLAREKVLTLVTGFLESLD
jgi:pimeloyl-ACP methyl ester carboxylesterase